MTQMTSRAIVSRFHPPDCTCDGKAPWCPVCLLKAATLLRIAHPEAVSIAMLRRHIPRLSGREASILLEATRRIRI